MTTTASTNESHASLEQNILTAPTCPTWCENDASHQFDLVTETGRLVRFHELGFGHGVTAVLDEWLAFPETGPELNSGNAHVLLVDAPDELTPAGAREFAASVLAAAEFAAGLGAEGTA